jgi:UDP-glucose 4-epimerase
MITDQHEIPEPESPDGYTWMEAEQILSRIINYSDLQDLDLANFNLKGVWSKHDNVLEMPVFTKDHLIKIIAYFVGRSLASVEL